MTLEAVAIQVGWDYKAPLTKSKAITVTHPLHDETISELQKLVNSQ